MAVIWQKDYRGRHYEVRTAGNSVRLYTNGAFHSQYNPRHLFMGAVWDILSLPVLFMPAQPHTVMMLGVGGGTVIHQLDRLVAPDKITGIELDPIHLDVARRFFRSDLSNVDLIEADALDWMRNSRKRFDVVVDDIFVDSESDPERPHPTDESWFALLDRHTTARGVVIQNYLSPRNAKQQLERHASVLTRAFRTGLMFTTSRYDNGILALYRDEIDVRQTRRKINEKIREVDEKATRRLDYQLSQLF